MQCLEAHETLKIIVCAIPTCFEVYGYSWVTHNSKMIVE